MKHPHSRIGTATLSLLAGLVLGAWTPPARAAGAVMGFNNKTKCSIYVEAISKVGRRVVKDRMLLIGPGKVAYHVNIPLSNRLINIYDANKPGKLLFSGSLTVTQNTFFEVQTTGGATPRVKLVPAKPPAPKKNPPKNQAPKQDN
jgi:hypothetical protein